MKNILSILFIAAITFSSIGCKQSPKNEGPTSPQKEDSRVVTKKKLVRELNKNIDSDSLLLTIKNMIYVTKGEIKNMIPAAEVIMEHRLSQTEKKSYVILDKDLWEYEFIFSGKTMSAINQFAGCWIDFSEDLTYTYGRYEQQQGSGTYTYSPASGLLLMIDDSGNVKPQEFEAKVFDRTLVMDGNDIYKDNNYNAKLKRITEIPKKAVQ